MMDIYHIVNNKSVNERFMYEFNIDSISLIDLYKIDNAIIILDKENLYSIDKFNDSCFYVLLYDTYENIENLRNAFLVNRNIRGYINSYSGKLHFNQMLSIVSEGHYWFSPHAIVDLIGIVDEQLDNTEILNLLTRKEQEVSIEIAKGCSNKEIAIHLGVSESTIKQHLSRIYRKTGLDSRLNLALKLKGVNNA